MALGAAGLAPAMAGTAPSMILNGNSVNIAVQGPNHSLKFYWAVKALPAGLQIAVVVQRAVAVR